MIVIFLAVTTAPLPVVVVVVTAAAAITASSCMEQWVSSPTARQKECFYAWWEKNTTLTPCVQSTTIFPSLGSSRPCATLDARICFSVANMLPVLSW